MSDYTYAIIGRIVVYGSALAIMGAIAWDLGRVVFRAGKDTWVQWLNALDAGTKWHEAWRLPWVFAHDIRDQWQAMWGGYSTSARRNPPVDRRG